MKCCKHGEKWHIVWICVYFYFFSGVFSKNIVRLDVLSFVSRSILGFYVSSLKTNIGLLYSQVCFIWFIAVVVLLLSRDCDFIFYLYAGLLNVKI